MKSLFRRLLGGPAKRGFILVAGGTALGQLLPVALSPILSRIYSPNAFALLATFSAIVTMGGVVSAARLEMAIPTARTDSEALGIARAGLGISAWFAILGTPLAVLFGPATGSLLNVPSLGHWFWLAPLGCAFVSCWIVLNQLAVREGLFAVIGQRNLLRGVATGASQCLAGIAGFLPGGLALGFAIGHLSAAASMLRGPLFPRDILLGIQEAWATLKRFRAFSAALTVSGLFNVAGNQLPILIFATGYPTAAVGWLGLTQRTLALPVSLIGASLAQVYVSDLAKAFRENRSPYEFFRRVSLGVGGVALLGAIVLVIWGPSLFEIVFGDQWKSSGIYARYLSIGIATQLVATPISQTLMVLNRTTSQVMWDTGRLAAVSAAVAVSMALGQPPATTVLAFSLAMALTYAAMWMMARRAILRVAFPAADEA